MELKELQKTQQELQLVKKEKEELKAKLETPKEEVIDKKCIYLSDKPNYYYYANISSVYRWNEILKENKLKPDFVKEALTDDDKFLKLCELNSNNGWYVIGKVVRKTYDYLLETRCGKLAVEVDDYSENINTYRLDEENGSHYSNEDMAIGHRNNIVKNNIEYYLENYADKYDEE